MTQFFNLSETEARATALALDCLSDQGWAASLLARISDQGGISRSNMPTLFEARFALALHDSGIAPKYEYATGVGNTTVDFQFGPWLVELYSLEESTAVKSATWEDGPFFGRGLATFQPMGSSESERIDRQRAHDLSLLDASSEPEALKAAIRKEVMAEATKEQKAQNELSRQSPAGEIVKAIERVAGKVVDENEHPKKFPTPDGSRLSILVVDVRALGIAGPDQYDCDLIAHGADAVPSSIERQLITSSGKIFPIRGVFDARNMLKGAQVFRDNVHCLGLVSEQTYARDELRHAIRFYANPQLFASAEEARHALSDFPLFPRA